MRITAILAALALAGGCAGTAPDGTTPRPDAAPALLRLLEQGRLSMVNRDAEPLREGRWRGVRLDEREGYGAAWIEGSDLGDGTIEVFVRGRDVEGRSFVGLAFRGEDDERYDAVYLRPFNFRSDDALQRSRAVQYVSHPDFTWRRLREEHPGAYEQPVTPAPDPEGWVRLRVVLRYPMVRVYVGGAQEPSLEVRQLSERRRGRVGLWVGNPSGGDFAGLRITPAR